MMHTHVCVCVCVYVYVSHFTHIERTKNASNGDYSETSKPESTVDLAWV